MGFGVLIDNMIKGLTCLHEITSRNLIEKLVLNEMAHVLQASVFVPLALYISGKQNKKRKDRARYLWQNHLNYPGSSAQAITIKAILAQMHIKRNNSWSVG